MQKSRVELSNVKNALQNLKSSRPNELDSVVAGFEGIDYPTIDEILERWLRGLEVISSSKWMDESTSILFDNTISLGLKDLVAVISQANSHGAVWLLTSGGFTQRAAAITQTIEQLSNQRAEASKIYAKALREKTLEDARTIASAAEIARDLKQKQIDASKTLGEIGVTFTDATKLSNDLHESITALSARNSETEASRTGAQEAQKASTEASAEIIRLRGVSENTVKSLEDRVADLNQKLEEALQTSNEANQSLREALIDVKKKGLAEAFAGRASKSTTEKRLWIFVFAAAVLGLVISAQTFAVDINKLEYEAFLVALFRRAALAAPAVWLGWYAAKQIGRLNRVIEDYEYKAATALAFEGYKSEIEVSGDSELLRELLKKTIDNFGDNPVRLLDGDSQTPSTPTEEALDRLLNDSQVKKLTALAKMFNPNNK